MKLVIAVLLVCGVYCELTESCKEATAALVQETQRFLAAQAQESPLTAVQPLFMASTRWPEGCSEVVAAVTELVLLLSEDLTSLPECVEDLYHFLDQLLELGLHIAENNGSLVLQTLYALLEVLQRLAKDCK